MNLTTISEISRAMNISTRTLRYYEQIGLIESVKKDDYAYRTYDEATVTRLQQILVLRKLRISLKQIALILRSENTAAIIEAFQQNLAEVDEEITALSTIREIISRFITRLNESLQSAAPDGADIKLNLLDDTALLEAVDALTVRKIPLKEEKKQKKTAADLEQASDKLNRLTDRDVRIVYLPPSTVAAAHHIGDGCEGVVYGQIAKFINENNLHERKPDFRAFGFNNPMAGLENTPSAGYEAWVTVPDDMAVPAPLVKKHFTGGLYAAHMIPMGAFEEWAWLRQWVLSNKTYDHAWGEVRVTPHDPDMDWAMEEPLNFYNIVREWGRSADTQQLDLLFPIKPKAAARTRHPQEKIIDTFNYNGAAVEVVEWSETIWCGKIGYQGETTSDPHVDWVQPILDGFFALDRTSARQRTEPDWDVCIDINHLSHERPYGVMCGFLVGTEQQPAGFDVYKVPTGQYLRIAITEESAAALGAPPWEGGKPPLEWVGEQLAPQFGYRCGGDRLSVFEYYGYYKSDQNMHEFRYLYVPVEKIEK
ncbi:MAG: effector binding domain-containing protein [Oscillospiraceae bacterium]|nr:effector binding domain-containing protein [Oscillospiraceae bacterium]